MSGHSRGFCLLDGHDLYCWGDNGNGESGLPLLLNPDVSPPAQILPNYDWAQVSRKTRSTCAVTTTGDLYCWGYNSEGQLGIGTQGYTAPPTQVLPAGVWASVSVSYETTCGTQTNGTLWCWGRNWYGQLGQGYSGFDVVTSPLQVGEATDWAMVSSGDDSVCATRINGDLYCWGRNNRGQLGTGNFNAKWRPFLVADGYVSVSTSINRTCGIRYEGELWCWGTMVDSEVVTSPTRIGTETDWHSAAASGVIALRND